MEMGPLLLTGVKCPLVSVFSHQGPPCTVELSSHARSRSIGTFQQLRIVDQWRSYASILKPVKERRARNGNILHTHKQTAFHNSVTAFFFFLSSALSFLEEINHSTFLEELSDCIKWLLATVQEENSKRKSL